MANIALGKISITGELANTTDVPVNPNYGNGYTADVMVGNSYIYVVHSSLSYVSTYTKNANGSLGSRQWTNNWYSQDNLIAEICANNSSVPIAYAVYVEGGVDYLVGWSSSGSYLYRWTISSGSISGRVQYTVCPSVCSAYSRGGWDGNRYVYFFERGTRKIYRWDIQSKSTAMTEIVTLSTTASTLMGSSFTGSGLLVDTTNGFVYGGSGNNQSNGHLNCWLLSDGSLTNAPILSADMTSIGVTPLSADAATIQLNPTNATVAYYTSTYIAKVVTLSVTVNNLFTKAATSITRTSATLNGNITVSGGAITEHGFCWSSTSTAPTISDSKTTLGARSVSGDIVSSITDLAVGTRYYYRLYVTRTSTTEYGNASTLVTSGCASGDLDFAYESTPSFTTLTTGQVSGVSDVLVGQSYVYLLKGNMNTVLQCSKNANGTINAYVRTVDWYSADTTIANICVSASSQPYSYTMYVESSKDYLVGWGTGSTIYVWEVDPTTGLIKNRVSYATPEAMTTYCRAGWDGTRYVYFWKNDTYKMYRWDLQNKSTQPTLLFTGSNNRSMTSSYTGSGIYIANGKGYWGSGANQSNGFLACWNMTTGAIIGGAIKAENLATIGVTSYGSGSDMGTFQISPLHPRIAYYIATSYALVRYIMIVSYPTLSDSVITDRGYTSGTATSTVTALGDGVNDCGHVWSTSPSPDISTSPYTSFGVIGLSSSFSSDLPGLSPGTLYYIRPYSKTLNNSVGYGNQTTMTTRIGLATITTQSPTDISYRTTNVGGTITDLGGS